MALGLLLVSGSIPAITGTGGHSCSDKVPASLLTQLAIQFQGYRVLEPAEYDPEDVANQKRVRDGDPCLSVAAVDADGDGTLDYGLVITAPEGVLIVIARDRGTEGWQISRMSVPVPYKQPVRTYIRSLDIPGAQYDNTIHDKGAEFVPELVAVEKIKPKRPGFMAGVHAGIDDIGIFYTNKGWVRIWLDM